MFYRSKSKPKQTYYLFIWIANDKYKIIHLFWIANDKYKKYEIEIRSIQHQLKLKIQPTNTLETIQKNNTTQHPTTEKGCFQRLTSIFWQVLQVLLNWFYLWIFLWWCDVHRMCYICNLLLCNEFEYSLSSSSIEHKPKVVEHK